VLVSQESPTVAHRKDTSEQIPGKGYKSGVKTSVLSGTNTIQLCVAASQFPIQDLTKCYDLR